MSADPMFWLATAAFAWGLSLASYRWFAVHNGWPMGEWQAHRPGLPIAIGVLAVAFAMAFAVFRGGDTALVLPLFGLVCALAWTAVTRVAAQSALLLAPVAVIALLTFWVAAANQIAALHGAHGLFTGTSGYDLGRDATDPGRFSSEASTAGAPRPAATDREGRAFDRDRGITFGDPQPAPRSATGARN